MIAFSGVFGLLWRAGERDAAFEDQNPAALTIPYSYLVGQFARQSTTWQFASLLTSSLQLRYPRGKNSSFSTCIAYPPYIGEFAQQTGHLGGGQVPLKGKCLWSPKSSGCLG